MYFKRPLSCTRFVIIYIWNKTNTEYIVFLSYCLLNTPHCQPQRKPISNDFLSLIFIVIDFCQFDNLCTLYYTCIPLIQLISHGVIKR